MKMKRLHEKETGMHYFLIIIYMLLCSFAGNAHAGGCGVTIKYDGKGAGQVVFNGKVHTSKGLVCPDCHEGRDFLPALFEMKKGADLISMRKMQLGRSCGYCHDGKQAFSATDSFDCSKCHRK